MLIQVLLFLAGLLLLVAGGHVLIRGAAALAQRLGVSSMIIGLTTVAFGTSAPELAVSLLSAKSGSTDITFGNVIGSNIANIGLLLGITAMFRPVTVHGQVVVREIPMMLLGCAATLVLAMDVVLDAGVAASAAPTDRVDRADGILLLLLFGVFLYYTGVDAVRQRRKQDPLIAEARTAAALEVGRTPPGLLSSGLLVVAGLGGLIYGGHLLVESAVAMARALAVPEVVIGVTIVAAGTSLPELVTCILAVRQGMNDLAIGNIVGSNIFNLLLVLGLTAALLPVPIPAGGGVDLLVMTAFGLVLLPMAVTHQRLVNRLEAGLLLAGYVGYVVWQVVR